MSAVLDALIDPSAQLRAHRVQQSTFGFEILGGLDQLMAQ